MNRITKLVSIAVLLLPLLGGCSKYTAPSPLDGIWRVESVELEEGVVYPVPETESAYWNFSNVVYSVGTVSKETNGYRQRGWGNVYFERDLIRFVPDDRSPANFLVPGTDKDTTELKLRYKVWKGELQLIGEGFILHLTKG